MSVWNDLEKDASINHWQGDHEFMVASVLTEQWDDGRPRYKIDGQLNTARGWKANITLSDDMTDEEVTAQKDTWSQAKKKGVLLNHNNCENLKTYGVTGGPASLEEGTIIEVRVDKRLHNGKEYPDIRVVYPKGTLEKKESAQAKRDENMPGF